MDYSAKAVEIPEGQGEFIDSNEEYWDAVIKDADLYHKKHPSARALDFITDFLHDLERRKPVC